MSIVAYQAAMRAGASFSTEPTALTAHLFPLWQKLRASVAYDGWWRLHHNAVYPGIMAQRRPRRE